MTDRTESTEMPSLDALLDLLLGLAVIVRRNAAPDDQNRIDELLAKVAGTTQ